VLRQQTSIVHVTRLLRNQHQAGPSPTCHGWMTALAPRSLRTGRSVWPVWWPSARWRCWAQRLNGCCKLFTTSCRVTTQSYINLDLWIYSSCHRPKFFSQKKNIYIQTSEYCYGEF